MCVGSNKQTWQRIEWVSEWEALSVVTSLVCIKVIFILRNSNRQQHCPTATATTLRNSSNNNITQQQQQQQQAKCCLPFARVGCSLFVAGFHYSATSNEPRATSSIRWADCFICLVSWHDSVDAWFGAVYIRCIFGAYSYWLAGPPITDNDDAASETTISGDLSLTGESVSTNRAETGEALFVTTDERHTTTILIYIWTINLNSTISWPTNPPNNNRPTTHQQPSHRTTKNVRPNPACINAHVMHLDEILS